MPVRLADVAQIEGALGGRRARRGMSILSALALVAALVVPSAVAQAPGGIKACWDEIEPAPFTDTAGLSAESVAAIDCVAHYGITKGTSATTYSPDALVTRLQTARFLARTVVALELGLPEATSVSFDDLGSVDDDGREAVAQLQMLGIVKGMSTRRFAPDESVQRAQIAQFLLRLLKLADVTPPDPAEDSFDDLGDVSGDAREAIGVTAALGIVRAQEPGRFDPRAPVTREDMALLLARTLEVAGARPVRLELSLSSELVMAGGAAEATVRATKPDGEPFPGLLIDVFAAYGVSPGGACNLDDGAHVNGGDAGTSQDCRIDGGDPRTDMTGEARVGLAHSPRPVALWIYAWAGTEGQEFDYDEVRAQVRARIGWHSQPSAVTITDPLRPEFGRGVTVEARLVGRNAVGRRMVLAAGAADAAATGAGAPRTLLVGITNGAGRVYFELPGLVDPAEDHQRGLPVAETVLVFWDRNGNSVHDGPAELSAQTVLTWRLA